MIFRDTEDASASLATSPRPSTRVGKPSKLEVFIELVMQKIVRPMHIGRAIGLHPQFPVENRFMPAARAEFRSLGRR